MKAVTGIEGKESRQERTRLSLGGANNSRTIAALRVGLSLLNLLIVYTNPAGLGRHAALIYASLSLYLCYSALLCLLTFRPHPATYPIYVWTHWVDLSCYALLVAFTGGTTSVFFFGLTFPILIASFRWGFAAGLRVVIASVLLVNGLGFFFTSTPLGTDLTRYLLWPIYLLTFGYMIAYWCGLEITLKRRLTLLKDITRMSNPRLGVDATINSVLKRLCGFYSADLSLLILDRAIAATHYFQCGDDGRRPAAGTRRDMDGLSRLLGTLPPQYAVAYTERALKYGFQSGGYYAYDTAEERTVSEEWAEREKLAATLDAGSYIIVPLRSRREVAGHILISASHGRAFKASDVHFLLHIADHLMPVLNHIKLVDRLTLAASEEERKRIARDIHDGIIQPYIGLQMGLAGVRHKLIQHGVPEASRDIEQLIEITDKGIDDLRRYVRGLKEVGEPNWKLLPAIRRFAAKFSEASEIKVEVVCESETCVNDRLAGEAFQIVVEGLSNIRRHTPADHAAIKLHCDDDALILQIENGPTGRNGFKPFTPRSITERTTALGGHVEVKRREDGGTIVRAEIPL